MGAMQVKGIKVEAECVVTHEVNVEPFHFPKVEFEIEKVDVKKEEEEEKIKNDFAAKEKELEAEIAPEIKEELKAKVDFEETKVKLEVPDYKPQHPIEWYRHACRKNPNNMYLCNHKLREKHEREEHERKWAAAVLEAASQDVAKLTAKETEIIFVNDANVQISEAERKDLRDKHLKAAALEDDVKAVLAKEVKREKDAAEKAGKPVPPLPQGRPDEKKKADHKK